MTKISYYTPDGLTKLLEELDNLKTQGRAEVAGDLSEARSKGDLKENAEYDAAKEAQKTLENKIAKLEQSLLNARVIEPCNIDTSQVSPLTTVTLYNTKLCRDFTYTLVPEAEADIKQGKISIESPIGKGILGKKINEEVEIKTPSAPIVFKIKEIKI